MPFKDKSVAVHWGGSGRFPLPLDRSDFGFHHLGDISLRVRPAGEPYTPTTSNGQPFALHSLEIRRIPRLLTPVL